VNEVGGFFESFGLADTAEFGVVIDAADQPPVQANLEKLAKIKAAGIRTAALYIDFPAQYAKFDHLSADEQADALIELGRNQKKLGYTNVWAVVQGHCSPHCTHEPCSQPCTDCPAPYNGTHGSCKVLCDTTRTFTSKQGKYKGQSLFDVIVAQVRMDNVGVPASPLWLKHDDDMLPSAESVMSAMARVSVGVSRLKPMSFSFVGHG
jgi:hypothetical protein